MGRADRPAPLGLANPSGSMFPHCRPPSIPYLTAVGLRWVAGLTARRPVGLANPLGSGFDRLGPHSATEIMQINTMRNNGLTPFVFGSQLTGKAGCEVWFMIPGGRN